MTAHRACLAALAAALLLVAAADALAQPVAAANDAPMRDAATSPASAVAAQAPVIDLQDALGRARANSARFRSAVIGTQLARQDRVQARAAMLPAFRYGTSYIYTQGNGTPTGVFAANNGVHEYIAQGDAHEELGLARVAKYRRAQAASALARAREEIAARGLALTVTEEYYGLLAAERVQANAQAAAREARHFVELSKKLEQNGEAAHSDVIKAQLQLNERTQSLREAQLAARNAKLALAVLLFPDFTEQFTVVDDLHLAPPLPDFSAAQRLAAHNNAEIRAAMAALRVADQDVAVARSGHLPTLSLDYWYGIDAPQFATRSNGANNLGYSAEATLNLPLFDWGAVRSKVRQAELRKTLARAQLSQTQRAALANLHSFWGEASTARAQLELARNSLSLAAQSLRLTNLRYGAGEATALEVVDAENSLAQARNANDEAAARYHIALANLQTLTGAF